MPNRRTILWATTLALFCGGCGSSAPYAMHPVKGKVVFDDGSALPGDIRSVLFYAQTAGMKSPSGSIEKDGTYELVTAEPGDGCPAGEYKVVVQCLTEADYHSTTPKQLIPAVYSDVKTTPLTVKVPGGTYDFKLSKTAK